MKLLADIYPCQTPSRLRGIGRYTLSLILELARSRGNNELTVLADALYPESFEELRCQFIRVLPAGSFLPYYHQPTCDSPPQNAASIARIAQTLIEQAYQVVAPDIVLTPSLFEGWGGLEKGWVPLPDRNHPHHQRAVILYDLIPYVFREHYLESDPPLRDWYLKRMAMLPKFDLLLAISESTRQDAISILGIKPEKVVNILGASSSHFRKLELSDGEKQGWLYRLGISRPFVLYIGGNDFRKNMDGALRAFAGLPREITTSHQMVFNDVGDETVFRYKARMLGLADADLVVFRRRSDEELEALYNLCKLFIFPSLYEGLGLPILEAMICGAPVIASNNSSLPEVVGRSDALFDVSSDQAVTASIYKALTDDAFRADLAAFGPERAKQFSWQNTAQRAWDALESLQERNQLAVPRAISVSSGQPRLRLAHVSPLPPQKSGIAHYCSTLLPHLETFFGIDLFVEPGLDVSDVFLRKHFSIYPWTELLERRDNYEAVIYHMGNSEFHIPMLRLLQDVPGIVVNHDFYMSNLPFVSEVKSGERGIFYYEIDYSHGLRGVIDYIKHGIESARWAWPMNWKVLKYAQVIIVHSEHHSELIKNFYAYGWKPTLRVIKHLREIVPSISNSQKRVKRKKLGLDPAAFIYCSFGFMARTKLNNLTIQAFSQILSEIQDNTMLLFVGDLEGGEYGHETLNIIQELKLTEKVRITGFVSKREYEKYLACADVAIQLRTDSRGETSGALLDCMAYELPIISNAHGSMNDYDADVVVKLPDNPSIEELSQAMIRMHTDETFRLEKGRRARNLIIEQHDPEKMAAAYADVIIAAAQAKEQKLFSPLVDSILELGSPDALLQSSAKYAAANLALRCQPRILLDTTGFADSKLMQTGKEAGFQFIRDLFATSDQSVHIEVVHVQDGHLFRASRTAENIFDLPKLSLGSDPPVNIQPGDVLLLLDYLLPFSAQTPEIIEYIRRNGGRIVTMVEGWAETLLATPAVQSDVFLCSSHHVAEDVNACFEKAEAKREQTPILLYLRHDGENQPNHESVAHNSTLEKASKRIDMGGQADRPKLAEIATWMLDMMQGRRSYSPLSARGADEDVEERSAKGQTKPTTSDEDKSLQSYGAIQIRPEDEEISGVSADDSAPHARDDSEIAPEDAGDAKSRLFLRSCVCSQAMLESDEFQRWVERMKGRRGWMHRKLWEWCYIAQVLSERDLLRSGRRGLGFAVGQEPLSALFASCGCDVVATDLATEKVNKEVWIDTNQHAAELKELNEAQICPDDIFGQRVSFRFVDMNQIDDDLEGFDFLWSSCSFEHLGTLELGKQFIYNTMRCLKPGGIAVHTTEYNLSSNIETVEKGQDVIYRRRDLEEIAEHLRAGGNSIDLDFTLGTGPFDLHVDVSPYKQEAHLRLELWGYTCTSYGLIIQKAL